MRKLQPEELFILACAKIEPSAGEIDRINNLIPLIKNWDYTLKLAIENGMAPLVHNRIPLLGNGSMVPEQIRKSLQQVYYKTLSFGTILYQSFNEVVTAFKAEKIDIIPLKGILLADNLYKDIGLRQLSDIDILVKEEDIPKCVELMKQLGYYQDKDKAKELENYIHTAHLTKGVAKFDMHRKIHIDNEAYQVVISDLWENAVPANIGGVQLLTLEIHHQLIHLCLHLEKHFGIEIVQYKCFCDIANILDINRDMIDWHHLEALCSRYSCCSNVFKYLLLINEYFNVSLPNEITTKYSATLSHKFRKKFIDNFIYKNSWETTSVAQLKMQEGIIEKIIYVFKAVFPTVNFMTSRYRISHKILLPYYYFYRLYIGLKQLSRYAYKRLKT